MTTYTTVSSLDRVLGDFMGATFGASTATSARTFHPALDVRSSESEVTFIADVPGVKEEDLEVTLENHVLTIAGSRQFAADSKPTETAVMLGRSYGSFKRAFTLPENLDEEKLSAVLADGVLTVRIPKQPKVLPRKIAINGAALKGQVAAAPAETQAAAAE